MFLSHLILDPKKKNLNQKEFTITEMNSIKYIKCKNVLFHFRRGGRAASKAAQEKISNDVQEMANLNKKKRRPSTPKAKADTR